MSGAPSAPPPRPTATFLLDTTGTPQVWSLDAAGAWPRQLTVVDQRVTFADWSPARDELAFGMDADGNERVQFYRLAGDGSAVTPLTDRPAANHRWAGWCHDGDRFAFASDRRDVATCDGYVQGRDASGDDAELVLEGDGWLDVARFDLADRRLTDDVPVETLVLDDEGHGFSKLDNRIEAYRAIADFLGEHV